MDETDLTLVWKALADPSRRRILDLLRDGPRTTGDLCQAFEVSRFGVMKHLGILEDASLVLVRREGRLRWNHLNAGPIRAIYERWVRNYEDRWAASVFQLKEFAEDGNGGRGHGERQDMTSLFREIRIEQEFTIEAARGAVFDALTARISEWWTEPYIHQPKIDRMVLEPALGGRLYEDWGTGEGMVLGHVTSLKRGEELRISGPIGMRGPVSGEVLFTLADGESGTTRLALCHTAIGVMDEENEAAYSGGWQDLIGTRLRALVEDQA